MKENLNRFIKAQEEDYSIALQEIKNGRKVSHWMWYLFPQISGLGMSETSQYYAIKDLEEAREYLNDKILGARLLEISNELLNLTTNNPKDVLGDIDALKLNSSMTLFSYISEEQIFKDVIDKYYNGIPDDATIKICQQMESETSRTYNIH